MLQQIKGEEPFQVLNNAFSISPSNEGYQLQISSDGFNYSTLFSVGAGVTRLVTGVAAGSYYRLLGNDSDIVINWRKSCGEGGGGGGEYILPIASSNTLGGVMIGSGITIDSEGHISAQGGGSGDMDKLLAVSELPASAADGTVVALAEAQESGATIYGLYQAQGTLPPLVWHNYAEGGESGWTAYRTNAQDGYNANFWYVANNGDLCRIMAGLNFWGYPSIPYVQGDENCTVVQNGENDYTATCTSDPTGSAHIYIDGDYIYIMLDGLKFQRDNGDDGIRSAQVGEETGGGSNWVPVGGGEGSGIPIVESLRDEAAVAAEVGSFVGVYYGDERELYQKVSGGTIGQWSTYSDNDFNTTNHLVYENLEDFLDFTDGKVLFSTKYSNNSTLLNAIVEKNLQRIRLYSEDSGSTFATLNYLGEAVWFRTNQSASANYGVYVKWEKDGIYFYGRGQFCRLVNMLDMTTDGVYFKRISDPTKAEKMDLGFTGFTYGVPYWNNEGVIAGKAYDATARTVHFNTSASTASRGTAILFQSNQDNFPARMYVPTEAGSEGQILTFADATSAPVWTSWIKSVSITQDDYDALVEGGTTDPNTLYLIVDE